METSPMGFMGSNFCQRDSKRSGDDVKKKKNCALQFGAYKLFYDDVKISKKKSAIQFGAFSYPVVNFAQAIPKSHQKIRRIVVWHAVCALEDEYS